MDGSKLWDYAQTFLQNKKLPVSYPKFDIGTKLGKEALYLSILEPNAGISFGYEAWLFKLKNGTESLGIITSKTEKEITITVPGGISTTYKTIDIESNNKLHNSIMPAGLQATMSTQELVDLVSYLHSLKEPKN